MRYPRLQASALAAVISLMLACENNAGTELPGPPPGGSATGGTLGGPGLPSRGDGGAGELRVAILSPTAMQVLKANESPEVRARVSSVRPGTSEPSRDPVDSTSIAASIRRLGTGELVTSGKLLGPTPQGEYAGRFDLSKVGTGDYELSVTGSTDGGTRGMTMVRVRVDAGPSISIVTPKEGGSYKGSMLVDVIIDAAPFGPAKELEASLGLTPLALKPGAAPNRYETTVEFLSFMPPLNGAQVLRVAAKNSEDTRTEASVRFEIDNNGPVITDTEPKEGSVVGGIIRIRAKVQDPAGILGNSVVAVIGNKTDVNFRLELKPESTAGVYSALFDTARLTSCRPLPDPSLCIVFPNLSFRASDIISNESVVAYDIAVDNQPPLVDLFPPPDMRVIRYDQMQARTVCSWRFDPLGDYTRLGDMPDDLCAVPQVFDLRARIEDQGNRADGLKHPPISTVDPAATALYVLSDTSQPLVVDVDGDGVCDAINPKLVPTTMPATQSNQVLAIRLAALPPKGLADFTSDPSLPLGAPGVPSSVDYPGCFRGLNALVPRRLCGSQSLTVVIGYPAARGPLPAIWTLEPFTNGEPLCVGSQFDSFANEIPDERWACIAAAATDRLGNASVSAPLRVWIKRRGLPPSGMACPVPPTSAGPPPDCTGSFNRQTATVSGPGCKARAFPRREILNEGALPEGGP